MVSIADRLTDAYNAGFRNGATEALTVIVAISLCECGVGSACETGCNPDCCPQSVSCGVWQVFQAAHPGTAACASSPPCAATLAWAISNHGTTFAPWTTYRNGCYRSHLAAVRAVLATLPFGGPGACAPGCPGGSTCVAGQCQCPAGTGWNGAACVPLAPPPPPPASGSVLLAAVLLGGAAVGLYEARRRRLDWNAVLHDHSGAFAAAGRRGRAQRRPYEGFGVT